MIKEQSSDYKSLDELLRRYELNDRNVEEFGTSLDIARILDKSHDAVVKDIKGVVSSMSPNFIKVGDFKFNESTYQASNGEDMPIINMNRSSFLHILTMYDDEDRFLLIKAVMGINY